MQREPAAALVLAVARSPARDALLPLLADWAPGPATLGLQLLSGPAGKEGAVRSYAVKCLLNERPEEVSGRGAPLPGSVPCSRRRPL